MLPGFAKGKERAIARSARYFVLPLADYLPLRAAMQTPPSSGQRRRRQAFLARSLLLVGVGSVIFRGDERRH
jgi:hypothetical protein